MSEPLNQPQPQATQLRQAREAAGLHIAALAAALKVPVKKLEALENGRYDELPDLTFARALASSACRQLKVDPSAVLAQIPVGHQPLLGDPTSGLNAPFKGGQDGARNGHATGRWYQSPAVLFSLVLLLAAGTLLLLPQLEGSVQDMKDAFEQARAAVTQPQGQAPQPQSEAPGAVEAEKVSTAQSTSGLTGVAPPEASSVLPSSENVSSASAVAPAQASAPILLELQANSDSWVQVQDARGKSLTQRLLKAGEKVDFSTPAPYSVLLGRADAVQVLVRGQPFDLTPHTRNSVARFQVR